MHYIQGGGGEWGGEEGLEEEETQNAKWSGSTTGVNLVKMAESN